MGGSHNSGHERTSNDQKSDVHNPTSQEYRDAQSNHDQQIAENQKEE